MDLYRVALYVRVEPDHPKFWDLGASCLCVWVYDESDEDAAHQALEIVRPLKVYELVSNEALVVLASKDTDEKLCANAEQAREIGFALMLQTCPVGTGEWGDEKHSSLL